MNTQAKEAVMVVRNGTYTDQEEVFNGAIQMGTKRDQFIQQLDRLLHSREPGSRGKALRLAAQYLEMSPEDIVAESVVAWIKDRPQAASVKLLMAFGFSIEAARAAWCELQLM